MDRYLLTKSRTIEDMQRHVNTTLIQNLNTI
jgi:hypothetical protein